jgi:hypothetical protein
MLPCHYAIDGPHMHQYRDRGPLLPSMLKGRVELAGRRAKGTEAMPQ